MDITKYVVEFELMGLVGEYDVEELGNRYQEYLFGLTWFEMPASGNFKQAIGFISLELTGEVKIEDINTGGICVKIAFKYTELEEISQEETLERQKRSPVQALKNINTSILGGGERASQGDQGSIVSEVRKE